MSPVLKALGSLVSPSTCPGTNLNLPLVPSRSQGAMDLQDLERELCREPELGLTGAAVGGSMAYTGHCHHDVNQNPEPAPVWQGRPLHRTSYIDQYPAGPQYQQFARVGYQQSPQFSCQPSLGCYQLVPGSTFQPQGNRLHGLPVFSRRANQLPLGSPVAGSHRQPSCQQQPDYAAPFHPMSSQGRWLP